MNPWGLFDMHISLRLNPAKNLSRERIADVMRSSITVLVLTIFGLEANAIEYTYMYVGNTFTEIVNESSVPSPTTDNRVTIEVTVDLETNLGGNVSIRNFNPERMVAFTVSNGVDVLVFEETPSFTFNFNFAEDGTIRDWTVSAAKGGLTISSIFNRDRSQTNDYQVSVFDPGVWTLTSGESPPIDLTNEVGGVGIGTAANDTFIVDDEFDQIIDAGAGIDTVQAFISFQLGDDIEKLTLLGEDKIDATGNELDNVLEGNVNDNVLNGAAGADIMRGSSGNDTYIVDNQNDQVIETENNAALSIRGQGWKRLPSDGSEQGLIQQDIGDDIDSVVSTISYTLTDFVENLALDGFSDIDGTGNELDNTIIGNDGDNVLTTGLGENDSLTGGDGVDTFVISKATGSTVISDTPGEADTIDLRTFLDGADPSTLTVSGNGTSLLLLNSSGGTIEVTEFFPSEGSKSVEYFELGEGPVDFSEASSASAVSRLLGGAVNELVDDDNNYWNASILTAKGNTISAAEAQLYRTYSGALGRTPDQGGYDWWLNEINQGRRDLNQMAADFIWSTEFLGFFGAPDGNSIPNDEFVNHMYVNVFGREPDQGGFDFWFAELESGARTQARVLVDMTQSNEYVEQTLEGVVNFRGN